MNYFDENYQKSVNLLAKRILNVCEEDGFSGEEALVHAAEYLAELEIDIKNQMKRIQDTN